ncbi:MAG: PIG-L family deacetylase [Mariniphaga sp.]
MKDKLKYIFTSLLYKALLLLANKILPNFNCILILIPHPDDEILGLGGVILQTLQQGGKVHLVYLTDGEGSGVWPDKEEIKRQRIALSEQVCNKLGIQSEMINRFHLPDAAVPYTGQSGFDQVVMEITKLIETIKPHAVFATHKLDYWPYDHVACAEIALEAVKHSKHQTQLWYYWVWAWYNLRILQIFKLNYQKIVKVEIRNHIFLKKELTELYLKALTPDGKPWSGVLPNSLKKSLIQPFEIIEKCEHLVL